MSDADKARIERDKLRQREQERRRREAQVLMKLTTQLDNNDNFVPFQQNQIDMNRQSEMMAAFEENII